VLTHDIFDLVQQNVPQFDLASTRAGYDSTRIV
jgi:hypothetical protein